MAFLVIHISCGQKVEEKTVFVNRVWELFQKNCSWRYRGSYPPVVLILPTKWFSHLHLTIPKHASARIGRNSNSRFYNYSDAGVEELRTTVDLLRDQLNVCCDALVKALKRRDILIARRDAKCNMITALLHAYSMKRSEFFFFFNWKD